MLALRSIFSLFIALDLCWWIWADQRLRKIPRARGWRVLLALFVLIQAGGVAARVMFPGAVRGSGGFLPAPILAAQYLWHLLVLPFSFLAMVAYRMVRSSTLGIHWVMSRLLKREPSARMPSAREPDDRLISRRRLLGGLAVGAPPLLVAGITPVALGQFGKFRVRHVVLPVAQLPPNLEGLRIAQVSDIHVGRFLEPRMLPAIIEATNQLRADLVLLTGDLIDFALSDLPPALDAVNRMDAKHGVAMCLGNHDMIESGSEFTRRTLAAGVMLLAEQQKILRIRNEEVQLLGLPWVRGDGPTAVAMDRLLQLRKPGAFPILMAHHPHAFDPAVAAGLPLTLSGHTHGGQLMLTDHIGAGPLFFRYWSGLYRQGSSALFVSNGVGNWFPLRTHAPAEIVDITLTRKA